MVTTYSDKRTLQYAYSTLMYAQKEASLRRLVTKTKKAFKKERERERFEQQNKQTHGETHPQISRHIFSNIVTIERKRNKEGEE